MRSTPAVSRAARWRPAPRALLVTVLGSILLGFLPAAPAADPNPVPHSEYVWFKNVAGTFVNVSPRSLQVRVVQTSVVPNRRNIIRAQGLIRRQRVRMLRDLQKGDRLDVLYDIRGARNTWMLRGPGFYSVQRNATVLDFQVGDDMQVRTRRPPLAFDDRGNPRRHTAQELRALRGNGRLPGYQADLSDLQPGELVKVYLYRRRDPAGPKPLLPPAPIARLVEILN